MFTHCTKLSILVRRCSATPGLPGAHHMCVTWDERASFQTMACSRPPEPITKSFIGEGIEAGTRKNRKDFFELGAVIATHAPNHSMPLPSRRTN
jgi:hypothetical protein